MEKGKTKLASSLNDLLYINSWKFHKEGKRKDAKVVRNLPKLLAYEH